MGLAAQPAVSEEETRRVSEKYAGEGSEVTLFLGGDVMTGRGIDQVLPHPSRPVLYERYMKDAGGYVDLAEEFSGPIQRPVGFGHIWGDALGVLDAVKPDARIVNLETAVTVNDRPWPDKGIHYRMHPRNVPCLEAAGIDCCTLANNHTLDWGYAGLAETLETLRGARIQVAGAGDDLAEAMRPAVMALPGKGRLVVYSMATRDSGVPPSWAAGSHTAGINFLPDVEPGHTRHVTESIAQHKRPGDTVVASVHWGGNWGYDIRASQRSFAKRLVEAGADVVHGHSSHHAMGIEVFGDRPVLYGCGDLINDYEGITSNRDRYRGELPLLYFVTLEAATGRLLRLDMKPMRIRKFRLNSASEEEAEWLQGVLNREGRRLGTEVARSSGGMLRLGWG